MHKKECRCNNFQDNTRGILSLPPHLNKGVLRSHTSEKGGYLWGGVCQGGAFVRSSRLPTPVYVILMFLTLNNLKGYKLITLTEMAKV